MPNNIKEEFKGCPLCGSSSSMLGNLRFTRVCNRFGCPVRTPVGVSKAHANKAWVALWKLRLESNEP